MYDADAKPTLLTIGPTYAVARWRNLLITLWRGESTLAAADDISRQYRSVMTESSESFAILVIIESKTPLPNQEVRRSVATTMEQNASSISCMIGVLEISGIRGASMRSVLTALVLMTRAPYPVKICATAGEAAEWMAPIAIPKNGPPLRVTGIENAVRVFRRAIEGCTMAREVKL